MKKFLSLVLALVMTMSLVTVSAGAKDFTDDGKTTYGEAVDVISAIGVVDGYTDGSFNPDATLTRGAAAKIICNLILGPTTASALSADAAPFKDVPTSNNFSGYIAYCAQKQIINGYNDGTFRPAATLTSYAFMKMLLGALGYDGEIEGYTGANWSIQVAKTALNIGLDKGLEGEFVGTKPVSREEAALYAFNMLQADMIEYDTKTTVNVSGATVTIAGDQAKAVKWVNSATNDGNIKKDGFVQFAEQYFNKLKMDEKETDDFARPATKWTNKGDKIGTYADKADVTYVGNQKLGTIYADLTMTQKDSDAKVFYNGAAAKDVAVSKNNETKISSKNVNDKLAGDGTAVEVFYDEDNNDVRICLIDTYVGEITAVKENVADPFVRVNSFSELKDEGLSDVDLDNDKFETAASNFGEDDVVLFTYSLTAKEIKSVAKAESVEGVVSQYTTGKKLNLGDTEYKYNKNIAFAMGTESDMQTKNDYVVYLDANGLAIYVEEQEFDATDYAFVIAAEAAKEVGFNTDRAKLVLADGSLKTVTTDDDYRDLLGKIVTYRQDNNNEYVLREAPNSTFNGTVDANESIVGENDPTTIGPCKEGVSSGFKMENSRAQIETGKNTVYANSETVFVVYDGTDYEAYTGIKNAPTIAHKNGSAIEMYTYVRSGNILAFAFIDATGASITNGKRDVIFLAGQESVSKLIVDGNNNRFYTYNAVVDGKITTVKVLEDAAHMDAGEATNSVFMNAEYNSKDMIKDVTAIGSNNADYEEITSTGVKKLSGEYTIGLYDTNGDLVRYTVASDAKMFRVDEDGNITVIDEVADIKSDSNDGVIALLDKDNGDLAYIFVQENGDGKHENATDTTSGEVSEITYNDSDKKITVTASKKGNYTVTLYVVNGGEMVKLSSVKVTVDTVSGSNFTGTAKIGTLTAGSTYQLVCGDYSTVIG